MLYKDSAPTALKHHAAPCPRPRPPCPKRRRAGALRDASRGAGTAGERARLMKIAQPFMAGFWVGKPPQSRPGRQVLAHGHHLRTAANYFFRPSRDFFVSGLNHPALKS